MEERGFRQVMSRITLFLDSEHADGWNDGKHSVYWEVTRVDKNWACASECDDPQADLKLDTESHGYLWFKK